MTNHIADLNMFPPPLSKTDKYRSFMLRLANEFKTGDLMELKFYLEGRIQPGILESLHTVLDIFSYLQRQGWIGPEKLDELRYFLNDIGRSYMISMIDDFDDSRSRFPLKPKSDNYLEMDGYRLTIEGGRHFETAGGEFVEVKSGANYAITITNLNCHRGLCTIKIDDYEMFPQGIHLNPNEKCTIERPHRQAKKFKFFAIADAPPNSGINRWKTEQNGVIQVAVTPERADLKIICVAGGSTRRVITCSSKTTDLDFHTMVLMSFNAASGRVTILLNSWKMLGRRNVRLIDYGIQDGSQVQVNFGGMGGTIINSGLSSVAKTTTISKRDPKWRAGATTLENESQQSFELRDGLELDPMLTASLNLRLVAREDERVLPATGTCTPLVRATLIPPPVPC